MSGAGWGRTLVRGLLILPFAAGAGMAVQQAFNGHVGAASGSSLTSIYGIGPFVAARILAEVVDIARLATPFVEELRRRHAN